MRRSKLEMYIDVLNAVAHRGPLRLTHIMYKANVNCSILNEYLAFLIKQGLVEKRNVKKARIVFTITQHGIDVLKYFRELTKALPILLEENPNQTSNVLPTYGSEKKTCTLAALSEPSPFNS